MNTKRTTILFLLGKRPRLFDAVSDARGDAIAAPAQRLPGDLNAAAAFSRPFDAFVHGPRRNIGAHRVMREAIA